MSKFMRGTGHEGDTERLQNFGGETFWKLAATETIEIGEKSRLNCIRANPVSFPPFGNGYPHWDMYVLQATYVVTSKYATTASFQILTWSQFIITYTSHPTLCNTGLLKQLPSKFLLMPNS
jgi:hypothetical protein